MNEEYQKKYELTLILSPNLLEGEINSLEQEIRKGIKELKGNLKNQKKPEKRELSYPIKKFNSGYFVLLTFLLGPDKIEELSSLLKDKKDIIRYLINLTPEEPSFVKATGPRLVKDEKELKPTEFKKLTKEVTEKEIEILKKDSEKKRKKEKEVKLENIDEKLDEILGI